MGRTIRASCSSVCASSSDFAPDRGASCQAGAPHLQIRCVLDSRESCGQDPTMNRRTFVESSVATGCLHHSSRAREETHRIEKIRVQLYTVRNAMKGRLQQMR